MQDVEAVVGLYDQWVQSYPRDTAPRDNAALAYMALGQHEKALASAAGALQLDPKDSFAKQNLAVAYVHLNRYDEAKAVVEKAQAQGLNQPIGVLALLQIAGIHGDRATMDKLIVENTGKGYDATMLAISGGAESFLGKIKSSRTIFAHAIQVAQQNGQKELAASIQISAATADSELGFDSTQVRKEIEQGLAISDDSDSQTLAGVAWALVGETERSQQVMDRLSRQYPKRLLLNKGWIPIASALQAMHKNEPAEAVRLLEVTAPYRTRVISRRPWFQRDVLSGKAYSMAHDGGKAAVEFQKILDHRGIEGNSAFYPLAQLGLARALALQADNAKARTAYQDFFSMWKDADPDLPVLKAGQSGVREVAVVYFTEGFPKNACFAVFPDACQIFTIS